MIAEAVDSVSIVQKNCKMISEDVTIAEDMATRFLYYCKLI